LGEGSSASQESGGISGQRAWSSRAALPHPDLEEKATGFLANGLFPEKALSQSGRIDSVDCQSLPALIRLARPLPVVSLPPSEDIVNCCRHPHSKICGSYSATTPSTDWIALMLSPFSFRPFLWDSGKLNFVHRFKALVSFRKTEDQRIQGHSRNRVDCPRRS